MKYKRILVDTAVYSFAGYLVQPLTIASSLFVRRSIGPYLTGVMATLNLFVFYASFSHLGVLNAAERDLPYCVGSGETERFNHIRDTTFVTSLLMSSVFAVGMLGWALWSRGQLGLPLFIGTLAFAIYVIAWAWSAVYLTLLRTAQEFVFLGKVQVIVGVVGGVGNVIGVLLWQFWGLLAMTVLLMIAQIVILARRVPDHFSFRVDWPELRRLLLIGVPLLVFGLAMTGIRTVDNILVLRWLGTEALGFYSIALLANTAIFSLTNSFSGVLYPRMLKAYGGKPSVETLSAYVIRPSIVLAVSLPILIGGLFLLMPPLVFWLLPKFIPGIEALRIISITTFFLALFPIPINFLVARNQQLRASFMLMGAVAVAAAFGFVFTRANWGLSGIAVATGLGYFCCFLTISIYVLRYWLEWKAIAIFICDLCFPIAYATLLLIVVIWLPISFGTTPLASAALGIVQSCLFVLGYAPIVFLMDPKAGLISDFVRPLMQRVIERGLWRRRA